MASSLLNLSILVLCLTFVSTKSLEKAAEKEVIGRDKLLTTIEQLFLAGRKLKIYSEAYRFFLSFEDDGNPYLKAFFDALDSLSQYTQRSVEMMKASYQNVNNASLSGLDRLSIVLRRAKKEIDAEKISLEESINQTEDIFNHVSSKLAPHQQRRIYSLLHEIDDLIQRAKEVFYEFGDDSIVLLKKVTRAKEDISEVRQEATTRLEPSESITGKK
ncbi:hypothetical protein PoB_004273700 [Plakobranchus ocellatus]|uniref:Uncharacterized protein n=1 Tax=Plakobranchus ocellatus TaxID=259542 RepID=A0AAV4BAQ9_9GAST|nr:hypothetical protein PoB_004273700 [Plakobranchus ocellatus]